MKTDEIVYATLLCVLSFACSAKPDETAAHQYLEDKIVQLERAIARCEQAAIRQGAPDQETLLAVKQHPPEQTRVFLITRSALMLEACQTPELTDLAYTIGMFEASSVKNEIEQELSEIRALIYGKENWYIRERYQSLPQEMRNHLEQIPYFQSPFQNIPFIELLEATGEH